jgi:hypothetical protein
VNDFPAPLIFIVLLVIVGVAIYAGYVAKKKRQQAFRALARRLGCRYSIDDPFGLQSRFDSYFPTLNQGRNRYAFNVISGDRQGHGIFLFDHHYETTSTDSKGRTQTHHHYRSFVVVEHDLDLGRIEARPEGFFDKVKAVFGFDDIDFESAEFSRKYMVKAEDRKLAYAVFHPEMIEYFLTLGGFKVTTHRDVLLARYGGGRMKPPEFERTLRDAFEFLERLPRYLKKDRAT